MKDHVLYMAIINNKNIAINYARGKAKLSCFLYGNSIK